uniref:Uncharacterized protein n=1 Tax=Leptobrachium leishanense TaxID=445787 RepID=A0A8C5M6B8_9ANUR
MKISTFRDAPILGSARVLGTRSDAPNTGSQHWLSGWYPRGRRGWQSALTGPIQLDLKL